MPGLVDTHIHAPQYMNSGTGYDRQLLDWLDKYTYPTETRFKDAALAKQVYPLVVVSSVAQLQPYVLSATRVNSYIS